jgi:hypothetical protein
MADVRRRRPPGSATSGTSHDKVLHDDDDHDHARPKSIWTAIAPALLIASMASVVFVAWYCNNILPPPKPGILISTCYFKEMLTNIVI